MVKAKELKRIRRHRRIRRKLVGNPERPRLSVHRSPKNLFVHLVNDLEGQVLFTISTLDSELRKKKIYGGNVKTAILLGELLAQRLKKKGITRVVFDRSGYLYHGRIKALAESARKHGLEF